MPKSSSLKKNPRRSLDDYDDIELHSTARPDEEVEQRPLAMPNAEQLEILKKGIEAWNKWRSRNLSVEVQLSGADLRGANLRGANLKRTNLSEAQLAQADLEQANLGQADLSGADLGEANLRAAYLSGADLKAANLRRADLRRADLSNDLWRTNLSLAHLNQADLRDAFLTGALFTNALLLAADLGGAHLGGCNFSGAAMGNTIFANSELNEAIGLEDVEHTGPSRISTDIFTKSKANIPEVFLKGCGLSDWEIASVKLYNPDLSNHEVNEILYKMYDMRAQQALQISPLFISYSHVDSSFVDKIEAHLNRKGVRFWRDVHLATAGRLEKIVDRAMRLNPTVLLILSEHSIKSDWVQHEVRTARELEKEMGRDVLCPVALDDKWKKSPWPKRIMEQVMEYNILDFSIWKDDSKFENEFRKLIDGLELFYKG